MRETSAQPTPGAFMNWAELPPGSADGRHRFREMFDALPAAIYTTDADGRITYFNPACIEFSGRTPKIGSDQWCVTWKLYHADGTPMPHDQCPMAITLREGRAVRGAEAIAERPDGTRVWFITHPTPLLDADGAVIGGINMLVDITSRKQAELVQVRLAAIVESSEDAIISKDLDGIIRSWNHGAQRLFGYAAQEAIGKSVTMLMPPDRVNEEPGILERLRRGESVEHYETVRRRKDGTLVDVSLTVSPVRDARGRIVGASKIARDITERKRQEAALHRSEQKLQRVLETDAVAVLFFDYEGTLINANDVFLRMTGYRREQIDRRELTWRTMTPPEWVEASEKQIEQFSRTGRIGPYEKEYFLADGTRRWMVFAGRDLGDGTIAEFCIDTTETKRREADSYALAALGSEAITADDPQAIYEKIVTAAVGVMRSDFASMQLFHPDRGDAGELELLAHHGFDPEGVKFWKWVSANSTCVCGLTLRAGARVVIHDAGRDERLDEGQKRAYSAADICSMQSTPLFSRGGKLLGMISTHWRRPYQPSESELRNFDILARQAADVIERSQAEQAIRQNEGWLAAQKEALQSALDGQPLAQSLGVLVRGATDRFGPGSRVAFYRANADHTTLHHVVGMCSEYAELVDGFKVNVESFSCGLAAHTRRPVLTEDVKDEPRWQSWLVVAERFDFRGCWSFPLHTQKGELLGTFAVYWREPRRATQQDVDFASAVTDIAAIIVSQHNEASERQHATVSLARAKEEAEAANIAKDNFLATLSHELRTPLTPVVATLSSWESSRVFPRDLAEDLEMVRRNINLEARLIDDLLDLTRIAKGKFALDLEVLDVQKVLDSVVTMYLSEIRGNRIDLSLRSDARDCFVRADSGRLQQAFWNILKNAVKFTPAGGKIDIATRNHQQDHVQIIISDTGAGISENMLRRLFQPFEQETAGRYGGLGLGLAITKTLLEAQQGTIEVRSDGPGKGATFIITLPCVSQPLAAVPRTLETRDGENDLRADVGYRVLLVEDHPDTARVLARLLTGSGHTVTTSHCIAESLDALRTNEFDILLSDIGLPDGTGIDLIRAVRDRVRKRIPAIALTGFGMEEDVSRTREAGFDEHLTKPINFPRLIETIQRVGSAIPCA